MSKGWSNQAAQYLVNWATCPRCDSPGFAAGVCRHCGADLRGPVGAELADASDRAAEAIRVRQNLIDSLPAPATGPAVAEAPATIPATAVAAAVAPERSSSISVQSVLAVAGAGLFAVAAVVFVFLNPDLTDFGTRTAIIGAITLLFLAGAWLLGRAKLRFSAETVGALGMVLLVLDIWAFSGVAPPEVSGWLFAGIGTLVSSVAMLVLAVIGRIRSWLVAGVVGISFTPALFGYATENLQGALFGHIAVAFVALAVHELLRRLRPRFASQLIPESVTATALQVLVVIVVLIHLALLDIPELFPAAGYAAIFAVLAALSTRTLVPRFWSFLTGVLAAASLSLLVFAIRPDGIAWALVAFPLLGSVALAGLAALARSKLDLFTVRRDALLNGALSFVLLAASPAAMVTSAQGFQQFGGGAPSDILLGSILGLASAAAGVAALWYLAKRHAALVAALWIAIASLLGWSSWTALEPTTRVVVALALAAALIALVTRVRSIARAPNEVRDPFTIGAHALILLAAALAWTGVASSVWGGGAVVAMILLAAFTVPARLRVLHVAVAFAYALVVFANALSIAGLEAIPVLCLTTTLASITALVATLVPRIGARYWYAILIVTVVPFLLGIVSVLMVISGWTGLSTAVTFALALTLVLTRRPGLNRLVRTAAAAMLVPALAVVVICIGAEFILVSASPITLPIIAGIVAVTLASSDRIATVLDRNGLSAADARAVRNWIEISSVVTGAIAVLLSLLRDAAGLGTSFTVFVILALGAATGGLVTRRAFAWVVAALSATGALWSLLALVGVVVLEPYFLPPALGAAVIGAIAVARGHRGVGFYWIGLAFAIVPALALLAIGATGGQWRSMSLLGSAALLLLAGWALPRLADSRLGALASLRTPTLVLAIVAAASGCIRAVRFGWEFDGSSLDPSMVPALLMSIPAASIAGLAARLLSSAKTDDGTELTAIGRSRLAYIPAFLFLVVGPMTAIGPNWFAIFTLLGLTIVLLVAMIVTVSRATKRPVSLPPVWFTFALAWVTAVVGWSERELRVESFSIPLGFALLAAGVVAMRARDLAPPKATLTTWPIGFTGSWALLGPGLFVTFVPSVLSTATDPLTWRAILVIVLALAAILIGSMRRLAAPFIAGIAVLPIENLIVFFVQIGRSISAAPWWITLATAGAVLLVIAVTWERRDVGDRGMAARLRDLS